MRHPITHGSLFDHTRKSSSKLSGIEVLFKKFGILPSPHYRKEPLSNMREAMEPVRKPAKVARRGTWFPDHGGKGDMRS